MTTLEKTTFAGRPVYKIRLVKKGGDEDIEFYDSETGLKIGAISTHDSPMGPMQGTTAWSDYKKVRHSPPAGDGEGERHEHGDDHGRSPASSTARSTRRCSRCPPKIKALLK